MPRGQVMRTSPAVGNPVKEGSKVDLIVSAGLLTPDVKGMPRDQADGVAAQGGFVPEFVEQTDAAQPCTVIAQDPQPKAEIDKGAASPADPVAVHRPRVALAVGEQRPERPADDPDVQLVAIVPNVMFKDIQAARGELQAAGFKVKIKKVWAGAGSWPSFRRLGSRSRPARGRPSGSELAAPGRCQRSLREPCRRTRARPPSG